MSAHHSSPADQSPGRTLESRFWRLSVLNILTNLTVPLASLVDTALLGHLSDIRYLAGVSLAAVLFDYVYWTFGFLRMSTTGLTAQAFGAKETQEIYLTLYRALLLAFGLGLLVFVFQAPLRELGFHLLGGSEAVEIAGRDYFNARIWGAPAALANFAFLGWFLGREESRYALLMTAAAHTTNVVLDYLFIVRFDMAASGAGFATAISQYVMLSCALWLFRSSRRRDERGGNRSAVRMTHRWREILSAPALGRLFRLNGDILVRTVLLVSAFALFLNFSAVLGTVVLTANTILYRIQMLVAYFVDGAAFATESLAGIFQGGGDRRHLDRLRSYSLRAGLALSVPFAILVLFAPTFTFGLLTDHSETVQTATELSPWLVPALLLGSIAFIYDGYFLGLTRGRALRNCMIFSLTCGFLPFALAGVHLGSADLLWLSIVTFMFARSFSLWWADRATARLEVVR